MKILILLSALASLQVAVCAQDLTLMKGRVLDGNTSKVLAATIDVIDTKDDAVIANFNANSETGKFLVSLPAGKKYEVLFRFPGYADYKEKVNCRRLKGYHEIANDVEMLLLPEDVVKSIKKSDVRNTNFGDE